MISTHNKYSRIMAVSASRWGFGFVVIEGNNTLVDWGAKAATKDKTARCIREVEKLIRIYAPDAAVFYDYSVGSTRSTRVKRLNSRLVTLAKEHDITTELLMSEKVMRAFFPEGGGTRHDLAKILAERFSDELAFRLPPKRKAWMHQDRRMDIFDAAALAVAFIKNSRLNHKGYSEAKPERMIA